MSARSQPSRTRDMMGGSPLSARDRHYSPPPRERRDISAYPGARDRHYSPPPRETRDRPYVPTYPGARDRHYSPLPQERPNVTTHPATYHDSIPPLRRPNIPSQQRAGELAQLRAPNRKNFKEHKETLQKRAAVRGQSAGDMKGEYLWWIKDQFYELVRSGHVHPAEQDTFLGIKLEQRRLELINSVQPPKDQRSSGHQQSSGNQQSSRSQRSSGDHRSRHRQEARAHESTRAHPALGRSATTSQSSSKGGSYDESRGWQTSEFRTPHATNLADHSNAHVSAPAFNTSHATNLVRHPSGVTGKPQPRVTDEEIHSFIQSTIASQPSTNPASISNKRNAPKDFDTAPPSKRMTLVEPDMTTLIPGYKELLRERLRKKTEMIKLDIAKQERAKKKAQKAEEKAKQESIAAFERETAQEDRQHAKTLRQQARYERFKESYPGLDSDDFSEQDSEAEEFGEEKSISRKMAKLLGQTV